MDIFAKIAEKIIREQEGIIGPVALEQAGKVPGLTLNWPKHEVVLVGDKKEIVISDSSLLLFLRQHSQENHRKACRAV